eukprot:GILJ01006367.1.p1 GENE.GILJ01006367.1~~GILJ01006367.1.p1  ORF type:complete len:494 (-),score=42.22 GILJ01006367.1:19-1341(-)
MTLDHNIDGAKSPRDINIQRLRADMKRTLSLSNTRRASVSSDGSSAITDKYDFGHILGQGSFGLVKSARNRVTGEQVAIKILRTEEPEIRTSLRHEFEILKQLDHPGIVKVYELLEDEERGRMYLVMEFVQGVQLFEALQAEGAFSEAVASRLFRRVLSAIEYLHRMGVCHRDLKPHNVLVSKDLSSVKITDFNVSKHFGQNQFMMTMTGTLHFVAPEMILVGVYTQAVDIWSAGIVLYVMLSGYLPFDDEDDSEQVVIDKIKSGVLTFPSEPWLRISESAQDLVRRCLVFDPEQRITATEALQHPWITAGQLPAEPIPTAVQANIQHKVFPKIVSPESRKSILLPSTVTLVTSLAHARVSVPQKSRPDNHDTQSPAREASFSNPNLQWIFKVGTSSGDIPAPSPSAPTTSPSTANGGSSTHSSETKLQTSSSISLSEQQ